MNQEDILIKEDHDMREFINKDNKTMKLYLTLERGDVKTERVMIVTQSSLYDIPTIFEDMVDNLNSIEQAYGELATDNPKQF